MFRAKVNDSDKKVEPAEFCPAGSCIQNSRYTYSIGPKIGIDFRKARCV